MLQLITQIAQRAKSGDEQGKRLSKFIAQALGQLEDIGVPNPPSLIFETVDVTDKTRVLTFNLLKELKFHPPLLEFRVNQRPEAFRAIFF